MISIIGIKRFVLLLLLLSLNAALFLVVNWYLLPIEQNVERKYSVEQNKVSSLRRDINRIEIEFDQLDKQQGYYNKIKELGFFKTQDRAEAKEMFSLIQKESRVISAFVSVKPGVIVDDSEAEKASHKILMSEMNIKIKAFDDNDIYRYLDLVCKVFPGVITIRHVDIHREKDVNAALLRAIANGASPELVAAEVDLLWRTMIPQERVIGAAGALK